MKWIKILCLVISSCHLNVSAQNLAQTYQFAVDQYALGNRNVAEKAFKRVLFFDRENQYRTECLLKLAEISDSSDDQLTTLNYLGQAYFQTSDPYLQNTIQFNRVKIFIETSAYQKALAELYQIDTEIYPDRVSLYEGYCHYMLRDFLSAEAAFGTLCRTPASKMELTDLISKGLQIEKLNPKTYEIISYLFPGLGQIILGDARNSVNSILLNGTLVVLFIDTARKLSFFDATISVLPWLFRYYTGGAKLTRSLALQKKGEKHEENLMQIIKTITHQ